MSSKAKIAGAVIAVTVLAVGTGLWWTVLRETAPAKASVAAIGTNTGGTASTRTNPDGAWKLKPSASAFVGYRIQELFAGASVKRTAAGRTSKVEGTMTVHGESIPAAGITADLTALDSDQPRRDDSMGDHGLNTDQFPDATFTLTSPVALPAAPVKGRTYRVSASGELTLHGVKRAVSLTLETRWLGDTIAVAGSAPIELSDYRIDPLEVSTLVKIEDHGTFELQLVFVPS